MRSWAVFDSPVQEALHALKYRRSITGLGEALARQMTAPVQALGWRLDGVVPVPLGRNRLKERGYNQVSQVAEPLAYELGVAFLPEALRKVRETRSQVGLNMQQRGANVAGAYAAAPDLIRGRTLLLMDDVATTGSTIAACTSTLLAAGAAAVYVLTIARALAHHDLHRV